MCFLSRLLLLCLFLLPLPGNADNIADLASEDYGTRKAATDSLTRGKNTDDMALANAYFKYPDFEVRVLKVLDIEERKAREIVQRAMRLVCPRQADF